MARGIYVGVSNFEKRNLPSGYTQLGSIKSDGTQHFNTGFIPNQNTRVVCKAIYTQDSTATYLFGSDGGSGVAYFAFGSANGNLRLAYNTSSYYFTTGLSFTDVITIDVNKNVATINGSHSVTATSATFNSGYPLFLFADNRAGEVYGATPSEIVAFEIYDNGTLARDYVPCKNSSGAIGLYDMVNGTFGTGSGAFTAGSVTQQSVARKVKQIYVGVESKARRVKKGYIGIGGVARPFWGDYKIEYYGTITSLNTNVTKLASASVGNYALFSGGDVSYGVDTNVVNAYDKSLTRTLPTALGIEKYSHGGATVANKYAIFAGGSYKTGDTSSSSSKFTATVDAYDSSLTRTNPTNISSAREQLKGGSIGDYVLFASGVSGTYYTANNKMDVYNSSLTLSSGTTLNYGVQGYGVANVKDYLLFAGGYTPAAQSDGTYRKIVSAYDTSLTKTNPTALSVARNTDGVTVGSGKYAVFVGGWAGSDNREKGYQAIDVYNESLTKSTISNTVYFNEAVTTSLGDFGLIANGYSNSNTTCYCFDKSLTMSTYSFYPCRDGSASQVGNYAIFAGGYNSSSNSQNKATAFKLS